MQRTSNVEVAAINEGSAPGAETLPNQAGERPEQTGDRYGRPGAGGDTTASSRSMAIRREASNTYNEVTLIKRRADLEIQQNDQEALDAAPRNNAKAAQGPDR
jgi:hypothetical protein